MIKDNLHTNVKKLLSPIQTALFEEQTVEEAIQDLKKRTIDETVLYFYVVDIDYKLTGFVSTRDLLLSAHNKKITEIASDKIIYVKEDATLEDAIQTMKEKHLLAIPVLSNTGMLLGCINVSAHMDEMQDVAKSKNRMQIFQLLGLSLEDTKQLSISKDYKLRMPWISCNMVGGILCAAISGYYAFVLQKYLVLAMFIPLVLSLSESISMQSMTESFALSHKRMPIAYFLRHFKLSLLLALTSGIVIGALSYLWGEGSVPPIIISTGIIVSVCITSMIGSIVPFILNRYKLDPKVAAGPVVLMAADVVTTLLYFSIASSVIDYIVY